MTKTPITHEITSKEPPSANNERVTLLLVRRMRSPSIVRPTELDAARTTRGTLDVTRTAMPHAPQCISSFVT
jgi:hypothetical protein